MPIYCPQTATTYPTLTAFYDATRFLNVGRIVGEVSGTVAGGAISPTSANYPAGVEVKAALGEEFTGVFGAGAIVTDLQWTVANTRHLLLTGVQCTQSSTTLSIITSSIWSAGDLTVDGCGFTGGATAIAPSRTGSVWQVKNSVVRGCQQSGLNRGTGSGDSAYVPTMDVQNTSVYGCNLVNSIYQGGATRRIFAAGSTIKHNAALGNIYADWLRPLNLAEQNNVAFQYNASSDTSAKTNYLQAQSNEFNSLTGVTPASVWENPAAGDFRQKATSPLIGAGEAGANIGAFASAPTAPVTLVLTGTAATASIGQITTSKTTSSVSLSLTGTVATPAIGQITLQRNTSVTLTGTAATPAIGQIVLQRGAGVSLTGTVATSTIGQIVLQRDTSVALAGTVATPVIGQITLQRSTAVALRGTIATPAIGQITAIRETALTLTGLVATPAVGQIILQRNTAVALRGAVVSATIGRSLLSRATLLTLRDLAATPAIGPLQVSYPQNRNLTLAGLVITATVGSVTSYVGLATMSHTPVAITRLSAKISATPLNPTITAGRVPGAITVELKK